VVGNPICPSKLHGICVGLLECEKYYCGIYEVQCTKYEILWKYTRNRPSKLGEIRNSDTITTYFTERSEVYFYSISTVFLPNYFTERSEVYFYPISIVSRLPALGRYLIHCTWYFVQFLISSTASQYKTHQIHFLGRAPCGLQSIQSLCLLRSPKTS